VLAARPAPLNVAVKPAGGPQLSVAVAAEMWLAMAGIEEAVSKARPIPNSAKHRRNGFIEEVSIQDMLGISGETEYRHLVV